MNDIVIQAYDTNTNYIRIIFGAILIVAICMIIPIIGNYIYAWLEEKEKQEILAETTKDLSGEFFKNEE